MTTEMPSTLPLGERRYHVLGVLGRGGHGTVYEAELTGSEGFRKKVAVKLLRDHPPDPVLLSRLRDEARILGLLRDRAIVGVDPPTKLGGRWAVVMELVHGASLWRLLKRHGSIPPEVALEIVGEVCRALHAAWNAHGPDGAPLRLLHRDIKPGNIQVTSMGEVKILDFGIAKANLDREARTSTRAVVGTEGYIAPERFMGLEVEQTDVFPLGVVLWQLVTGERPDESALDDPTEEAGDLMGEALNLARRMMRQKPSDRPTPREVERHALKLARRGEVGLRDWAEEHVPAATGAKSDELVGSVLTETLGKEGTLTGEVTMRRALLAGSASVALLGVALIAVATGLGGWLWWTWEDRASVDVAEVPSGVVDVDDEPADADLSAGEVAPSGGERGDDEAAVDAVPAVEAAVDSPPAGEATAPAVDPAAPEAQPVAPRPSAVPRPAPAVVERTYSIRFGSQPPGATLQIDGVARSEATPLMDVALPAGTHTLRMVHEDQAVSYTFAVGAFEPTGHTCSFESLRCSSF